MKSFARILAVSFSLVAAIACVACSSGGASAPTAAEPTVEMYTLHLDVSYERNLIFAIYDVDVKVDDATVATISQGGELHQEESLERGTHIISFCKQGDESVVASSEVQLDEESFYGCSLKAHMSKIDINNEVFETAVARVPDDTAAAEQEEAEREAAAEQEEAERKAAEQEEAERKAAEQEEAERKAQEEAQKEEERKAEEEKKAEVEKKLKECEGKTAKQAADIARENGVRMTFIDASDKDITEDVLDETLQSVAESVTVSNVEVSSFWGTQVEFTIKGRFALTADNSEDFAKLLAVKDPADPIVAKFAKKYAGKIIEFDGCIQNVQNHGGYSTRYDLLIGAGDYSLDSFSGPNFQYRDIAVTSLKWKGKEPDAVSAGMNLHFVAKVDEYEDNTELFVLKPVTLKVR